MTTTVISVHPDTAVRHAADLLCAHQVTSLPVLDDDDRVIGIVSEADLIRDRMPSDRRSHLRRRPGSSPDPAQRVGEVMSDTVVCLAANADSADLAAVMLDNNVRAVPIVNGARLIGIVSRRDLLRALLRPDAEVTDDVVNHLRELAGDHAGWDVTVADGVVDIRGHFADAELDIVRGLAGQVPGVLRVHTHRRLWG